MITEKQRQERKLGVGGSDMPIILGLSSYKTPYQLYLEKIGEEVQEDEEESELQYWGNRLERIIIEEFSIRNNLKVEKPDTLIHPIYDFMRCNLDGYIPEINAVLEAKNVIQFKAYEWGESETDKIPIPYLVQVAHNCHVANTDYGYVACLIGGNKYGQYLYTRDLELEERLFQEAKKFWDCVQNRTPPAPIKQIDLKLMFPKHDPEKMLPINNEVQEQLTHMMNNRFEIKKLSELEEQYKFNIMQFMGNAECLVNNEGKPIVSWKSNKRGVRTFLLKGV